jgi:hypothetical protein
MLIETEMIHHDAKKGLAGGPRLGSIGESNRPTRAKPQGREGLAPGRVAGA